MTIRGILDRIASELTATGWTVYPRPVPDSNAPRYAEVGLGDASLVPATIDSPGLRLTVLVGLYADLRLPEGYDELIQALEVALSRLGSLTLIGDLEADGVLLDLPGVSVDGPIPVAQGAAGTGYWRALIRVPLTRKRL